MRTPGAAVVAGALVVALLGACGGSDEDDARKPVRAYVEAVANADGKRACDQLSEEATRELFATLDLQDPGLRSLDCPEALRRVALQSPRALKARFAKAEIGSVELDGSRGVVKLRPAAGTGRGDEDFGVSKVGDRWLISTLDPTRPAPPADESTRSVSKADAIAQADRICRDAGRRLARLGRPPKGNDLDKLRDYRVAAAAISDRTIGALKGITPPERDRRLYDRFVAAYELRDDLATELLESLERRDRRAAGRIGQRQSRLEVEQRQAAGAYGFQDCG